MSGSPVPSVVDIHTHFVPPAQAADRRETQFVGGRPAYSFHDLLYRIEEHVAAKLEAGIDLSVISSAAGFDAPLDACRRLNEGLLEAQQASDGRIVCMAHVPPAGGAPALEELQRALDAGLVGAAIASDVEGTPLDDPRLFEFYGALEEAGTFLFVHPAILPRGTEHLDAHDLTRSVGREFALVEDVVRLVDGGVLDRFPRLRVVMSHLGGGIASLLARIVAFEDRAFWGVGHDERHGTRPRRPFVEYLHENVYFDVAGSSGDVRSIRAALSWLPASRLLFGSDYPQEIRDGRSLRSFLDDVRSLPELRADLPQVLGGNARSLLESHVEVAS
jgi:aminocarboxymuconate-semialdehyde decarboxylase